VTTFRIPFCPEGGGGGNENTVGASFENSLENVDEEKREGHNPGKKEKQGGKQGQGRNGQRAAVKDLISRGGKKKRDGGAAQSRHRDLAQEQREQKKTP